MIFEETKCSTCDDSGSDECSVESRVFFPLAGASCHERKCQTERERGEGDIDKRRGEREERQEKGGRERGGGQKLTPSSTYYHNEENTLSGL